MPDAKVIVAVRTNGVLLCGARVDLHWIATRCEGSLRWDLRRIFEAAGYQEVKGSEKTKFAHVYNRINESLRPVVFSLFGGDATLFGRSWHAERKRGNNGNTDTTSFDNHWCSTIGLLVLLTFLPGYRKHPKDKQRACMLTRMFIEATMDRDVAMEILAEKPPAQAEALCDCPSADGFFCECISHLIAKKQFLLLTEKQKLTSQAVLAQLLYDMWLQRSCPACSAWTTSLLKCIAEKIDNKYLEWDVFNSGAVGDLVAGLAVWETSQNQQWLEGRLDARRDHQDVWRVHGEARCRFRVEV
jgi:hypothetical protein